VIVGGEQAGRLVAIGSRTKHNFPEAHRQLFTHREGRDRETFAVKRADAPFASNPIQRVRLDVLLIPENDELDNPVAGH